MIIAVKESQYNQRLRVTSIETILKMMKERCFDVQIAAIRNEADKKARGELKNELPQMFMFEPINLEAGSSVMNVKEHNGVFVFDVDIYDRFDEIKEQVFDKLKSKIIFAFKSPSGGLKFAIRSHDPIQDDEEYKRVYKIMVAQFKKLGIECEMDGKTCNINRATYVSDSSFVYVNLDANAYDATKVIAKVRADIVEENKKADILAKHQSTAKRDDANALRYRASAINSILNRIGPGNRHDCIFQIGIVIYSTGGSIYDVQSELELLRANRQYTESLSPASKAQDIYNTWVSNGSKLHESCFALSSAEKVALFREWRASR